MRQATGWLVSWVMFYVGHMFSVVMDLPGCGWAWHPYQWAMRVSDRVQETWRVRGGPWLEG